MQMSKNLFLVLALSGLLFAYLYNTFKSTKQIGKGPIVETLSGKLVGSIATSRTGKEFFEYLGIPYASPPVGERRFEVTLNNWFINIYKAFQLYSHQDFRFLGMGLNKLLHTDRNVCNWRC